MFPFTLTTCFFFFFFLMIFSLFSLLESLLCEGSSVWHLGGSVCLWPIFSDLETVSNGTHCPARCPASRSQCWDRHSGSVVTWQPIRASGSAGAWGLTHEPLFCTSRAFSTSAGTTLTQGPQHSANRHPSCSQGSGLPRFPSTQGPETRMQASQVCVLVTRPFFGQCA